MEPSDSATRRAELRLARMPFGSEQVGPFESLIAMPGPFELATRMMLPLFPASIALHVDWFNATRAGGIVSLRIAGEYLATLCTVKVLAPEPSTPRKNAGCARVISTPTRSQGAPSFVAFAVWVTLPPRDVPSINGL